MLIGADTMSHHLSLSFACGPYDRTEALAKDLVKPAGIDLNYILIEHPRDTYDRMLGGHEFDASEMSTSDYICRYAKGERDLVAIPVFPSRSFRHNCIAVNTNIVKKPSDLNGKRIGVQLYTMTAAVWIRELLQEAGVDLSTVTWVEGAFEKPGPHGKHQIKMLLRPIKLEKNENPSKSLSQLLEEGELAATIGAEPPANIGKIPHIQPLFLIALRQSRNIIRRRAYFLLCTQ
jgi:4,5-dihydroxyphthalate decarboxylase